MAFRATSNSWFNVSGGLRDQLDWASKTAVLSVYRRPQYPDLPEAFNRGYQTMERSDLNLEQTPSTRTLSRRRAYRHYGNE